ncbi:MAG: hypothetical protein JXA37_12975 [Chloroflexia bacterium]|nr:hypothetical protein [Chloroflexia bacterium]
MSEETKAFAEPTWAIVELFGHNVIAGQVSEVTIAGGPFLRVDVPVGDQVAGDPLAYTKFFHANAIYAITPSGEKEARQAASRIRGRPIATWIVPDPPRLPASWPACEDDRLEAAEEAAYLDYAGDEYDEESTF